MATAATFLTRRLASPTVWKVTAASPTHIPLRLFSRSTIVPWIIRHRRALHRCQPGLDYRSHVPSVLSYQRTRCLSTTHQRSRDHHFDTLKFVQRLKDEGFSEEQSKAMMLVLSDVIEESIQNLTRTMVLREGPSPLIEIPTPNPIHRIC